ncbi:acyltransferase [Microvirga sp. ACRRW]|uniref:acyltransferase family protein n=1 Tax=Microvirga sp. ACRRW TaxID=2918205 RepID=UPI001EF7401B|nr:acyltransferase [Microvirga sp. ACRRW]MCG7393548.1 acyltransferase [Microvirga sp. ACRRW]
MTEASKLPVRFYSLDALRGFAALSVVVWHWQHFFFHGSELPATFQRSEQPFYPLLRPLYEAGWYGVDLFFVLSGFVFFWLYRQRIEERQVSRADFWSLRFSRLYPLHLATFIAVAILQALFWRQNGTFFVYQHNDLFHAVLNLLFISNWGFERGYSFNAPIWSVSVEVFLYIVFFIGARFLSLTPARTLLIAAIGCGVSFLVPALGRGLTGFFMGGAAFWLLAWILRQSAERFALRCALGATILLWGLALSGMLLKPGTDMVVANGLLFPATILTIALVEIQKPSFGKRFAFLGDASYAIYLLHFPLEMLSMTLAISLGIGSQLFLSPWVFCTFLIILIALSLTIHKWFERPAMLYLRMRLLQPAKSTAGKFAG